MRVVIIGCGDPLKGDEALAWEAARELCALWPITSLLVRFCERLTPDLADPIAKADLVIFLGTAADEPVGRVTGELVAAAAGGTEPARLLAQVSDRFGSRPEAWSFRVGAERFGAGEELSAGARGALPDLLRQVSDLVTSRAAVHSA